MNTFVPRGQDYLTGARELDTKRLVKQLVECQQIYDALLTQQPVSIFHHPATQMWDKQLPALLDYAAAVYVAYQERFPGRRHKSGDYLASARAQFDGEFPPPEWVEELKPYHQAKLHWKDQQHYAQYEPRASTEPAYPITCEGRLKGWVHKPANSPKWFIASRYNKGYSSAWEAVSFLRKEVKDGLLL